LRKFTEFTISEWVKLAPLIQAFKEVRNDFLLSKFVNKNSTDVTSFLEANKNIQGKNIAVIIAFEQPWALNFLLEQAKINLASTHIIVFDNSMNVQKRMLINDVCKKNDVHYISLPSNPTKHVNRSHGLAMSWAYHNVIKKLEPNIFTFLDHDLIPLTKVNVEEKLEHQPIYGLLNKGNNDYWSLWAGFCTFKYSFVKERNLNFLYDFSRGLDTGGRNWESIYKNLSFTDICFANRAFQILAAPHTSDYREVEILDQSWVHMSGISYNNNFESKADFYSGIYKAINSGEKLIDLIQDGAK
jgi:hypothetical protein